MKRTFLLAVTALAALLATSCQKDDLGRILTATIEQYQHNDKAGNQGNNAKAYINSDNYACWENNDTVNINGVKYPISISGGNEHNYSATIQGEVPSDANLLAFYPASGVSSWSDDNITISLPQVQTYKETTVNGVTYQKIQNPMAAYCPADGNELKFRNLAALLKITITAPASESLSLNAIMVKGDDDQMLWGTAQLTLNNQNQPMLDVISNGSASVFLVFESSIEIDANSSKSFYIVVPDGSSFKNFTILVADAEQGIYKKVSKLGQSLPRNHIGAIAYTPADADKVYAILYTGSVDGFDPNAFGDAQIEEVGDGFIIFDNPVTVIGSYAFEDCSGLTSITLPEGVTSIGNSAFYGCRSLTSITLPSGVTSIGGKAFKYCISLTRIDLPAGVTSIGNNAFEDCSSFTSINLPSGVTSIGAFTFQRCRSLTSIDLPAGVTSIGNNAFEDCSSFTSINLPSGVASIGDMAFIGCSKLTSISLPENLNSIGGLAFGGCSSLNSVNCYRAEPPSLGISAFYGIPGTAVLHVPSGKVEVYSTSDWGTVFSGEGRIVEGFEED